MIHETIDKNTGAILFKRDPESIKLEKLMAIVEKLESENKELKKRIKKLEDNK